MHCPRRDAPPTAWFGTSVDRQHRVKIAETAFRQIEGVAIKWLSLEPLLEPLIFSDLSMFDWIVIGAQSATEQPEGPVPAFSPRIVCTRCGMIGADARPNWSEWHSPGAAWRD